jgi:hypothetical protein
MTCISHELSQIEPGVWVREPTAAASSPEIRARYLDQKTILDNDHKHYQKIKRIPQLKALWSKPFSTVVDIGGGHPKLASLLNVESIQVYDAQAEDYAKTASYFASLYKCSNVSYVQSDILEEPEWNGDLAICSHILEHLTPRQIRLVFSRLQGRSLIVYGPDIERCTGESWIHGGKRVPDHITFMTIEAMKRTMQEHGFISRIAGKFADDYLIFASRDRQWRWKWEAS